ncbi:scavenger receptor class B member 1-like isoform X1 [Daphnia pulicaria]|uniref:scavenger receptor class B member 1-like isoform X1 n=1 Tax=Daphnia pulicaria TaxID=35523 RepID=UPI001EEA90DA|nr:scavenger receptor class B member 1-like isoform X1 [Daphnia pulicaria]
MKTEADWKYSPVLLCRPDIHPYDLPRMRPSFPRTEGRQVQEEEYRIRTSTLRYWLIGILAVSAILFIVMGILVTMFFSQIIDNFIYKELVLKVGGETYEMWRKPPVEPQLKVYFFNVTNPRDFLQGEKPIFREIGPYVYNERWEKVNFTWHPNGTVSYQPTRTFFFNREMSYGDESDLVQTLNIPLVSAADQMKYAVKLTRLALGSMLGVLNQETFTVRSVRDLMWGYNDSLFKLAKDVMPPENVVPHDLFGLFVGKNGSASDGVFTIATGAKSMSNYAMIDNWNGMTNLPFWQSDQCNRIVGTDGTAFPPELTPNTTLHMFNPELCRAMPLVYYKDVVHNGVAGYRFGPPINAFDTPATNPDNACFCPPGTMERDGNCGIKGLFNISSCKFGAPMAVSWPHFLHGDPKLVEDVVGLNPDINRHGFFLDFQPKLTIAMSAAARMQINLMLSKVEDIKQVVGLREMAFPLFWFEDGIDKLPDDVSQKLKMVAEMPEAARAGISYSMFGLGGILLFCVALMIWKRMKSKSYGAGGVNNADVEFEKRTDAVTVHKTNGKSRPAEDSDLPR